MVKVLAVSYTPTGEPQIEVKTIAVDDLKAMQRLVGGWVERVSVPSLGLIMWVNEEGQLKNLPLHWTPFYPAPIAGNYFLSREMDGDLASLTEEDITDLKGLIEHGEDE